MFAAFTLALSVQVASIPPALPQNPGPERRAAAAALFAREPYRSEYSWPINIAASRLGADVLTARNANAYDRDARLADRLVSRARAGSEQLMDEAIRCVAEPIAERLSVPDLLALKAFASTPEGRNFWTYFVGSQPWQACFDPPVRVYLEPHIEEELAGVIAETPIR